MLDVQLRFQEFVRTNIPQDAPMGLPEKWDVRVDFQNYFEAGFLGAEIYYPEGNVPVSRPMLNDDNKRMLLDRGIPGAGGIAALPEEHRVLPSTC